MSGPGRPTKYEPDWMLGRLLELGKHGAGKAEMAVAIGISRDTFVRWAKENGEFSDAVKIATQESQAWWEQRGRERTFDAKDFSAVSYIFQMKNRFPDDWRDRQEIKTEGDLTEKTKQDVIEGVVRELTEAAKAREEGR